MQPQKINRDNYNYNSKPKKPPKPSNYKEPLNVLSSPKKSKQLEPINQNPYEANPSDDLEKAIFDLQDVKNSYLNEQKEFE